MSFINYSAKRTSHPKKMIDSSHHIEDLNHPLMEETEDRASNNYKFRSGREFVPAKKKILCRVTLISFAIIFAVTKVYTRYSNLSIFAGYKDEATFSPGDDEHNGPTVLSVVDEHTGRFIPAANNPLYDKFKSSLFVVHKTQEDEDVSDSFHSGIQLSLNKDSMSSYHEALELTWSSLDSNNVVDNDDILALYCHSSPSSSMVTDSTESIDLSKPRDAATIGQAISTSIFHSNGEDLDDNTWYIHSFPTIREEKCHFRMWRPQTSNEGKSELVLLAKSSDVHLPTLDTPTGIHLSLTNDPKEMVVQFITGYFGKPIVQVTHPDNAVTEYSGTSTTYSNEDMCQEPATKTDTGCFVRPGNLHTVILRNLVPNTKYTYRVGLDTLEHNNEKGLYSEEYYSFMTIPEVGSTEPYALIAYGDQGCPVDGWAKGGKKSAVMVQQELDNATIPIRAVHHFGDLSYARGNAHLWDDWLDMISVFTTRVPLLVGVSLVHSLLLSLFDVELILIVNSQLFLYCLNIPRLEIMNMIIHLVVQVKIQVVSTTIRDIILRYVCLRSLA